MSKNTLKTTFFLSILLAVSVCIVNTASSSDLYDPFCDVDQSHTWWRDYSPSAFQWKLENKSVFDRKGYAWKQAMKLTSPLTQLTCVAPKDLQYNLSTYLVRQKNRQPTPSAAILQYYSELYKNDESTHESMAFDQTRWSEEMGREGSLLREKMGLLTYYSGDLHIRARLVFPHYLADPPLFSHVNTLLKSCAKESDFCNLMNILDELDVKDRAVYIPLFSRYGIHKKYMEEEWEFANLMQALKLFPRDEREDLCKRTQGLFTGYGQGKDELRQLETFAKIPTATRTSLLLILEDIGFLKKSGSSSGFELFLKYFVREHDGQYFTCSISPKNRALCLQSLQFAHKHGLLQHCNLGYRLCDTLHPLYQLAKGELGIDALEFLAPDRTGIDYRNDFKINWGLSTLSKIDPTKISTLVQFLKDLKLYEGLIATYDFGKAMKRLAGFTEGQRAFFAHCVARQNMGESSPPHYTLPALDDQGIALLGGLTGSGLLPHYTTPSALMNLLSQIVSIAPAQQQRIFQFISDLRLCAFEGEENACTELLKALSPYTESDFSSAASLVRDTSDLGHKTISSIVTIIKSVQISEKKELIDSLLHTSHLPSVCKNSDVFIGVVAGLSSIPIKDRSVLIPLLQTPGVLDRYEDTSSEQLVHTLHSLGSKNRLIIIPYMSQSNLFDLCENSKEIRECMETLSQLNTPQRADFLKLKNTSQPKSYVDLIIAFLKQIKSP